MLPEYGLSLGRSLFAFNRQYDGPYSYFLARIISHWLMALKDPLVNVEDINPWGFCAPFAVWHFQKARTHRALIFHKAQRNTARGLLQTKSKSKVQL